MLRLQKGISLLEVLMSLTIIALILVMATRYFVRAHAYDNVNIVRQQIGAVIAAYEAWSGHEPTKSYKSGQNIYPDLIKSNFLDRSNYYSDADKEYYSPFHKPIEAMANDDGSITFKTQLPGEYFCKLLQDSYPASKCDGKGSFTYTSNLDSATTTR